jgi:hypothetical protein
MLFVEQLQQYTGRKIYVTRASQPPLAAAGWRSQVQPESVCVLLSPACVAHCYASKARKRHGVVIRVIPETAEGDIDIPALRQMLAQQVREQCW